jgi:putative transposase
MQQLGAVSSMSRPGNPYDNAFCEAFMKTLKQEEIYCGDYADLADLRAHVEEFIERYYNRVRLRSALAYLSPEAFEQEHGGQTTDPGPKLTYFAPPASTQP